MPVFLAPIYLAGVLIAAAPVILHLLHRRQPKPIPFSTLRFLQAAVARTRRSRRLTNVLTLLMRVLILLLIALAFALPKVRFAHWLPAGARTIVLILDASASLRCVNGDRTSFERAKAWAADLVNSLSEGDRVAVMAPGTHEPLVVFPAISDRTRVLAALDGVQPGYGHVDVVAALADALTRLDFGRGQTGLEVHLFSDFHAECWDGDAARELARRGRDADVIVYLNEVRPSLLANAGLRRVGLAPPALIGDGGFRVTAAVAASPDLTGETTVRLAGDGGELATASLEVAPGREASVVLTAQAPPGERPLSGTLSLPADAYEPDNTYHFSLPRVAGVPVLLVNGGGAADGRDVFFLRQAIQPGGRPNTVVVPETWDWNAFLARSADACRLVLISNPPRLDEAARHRIEGLAAAGAHIWILPGEAGDISGDLKGLTAFAGLAISKETLDTPAAMTLVPGRPPESLEARIETALGAPVSVPVSRRLRLEQAADPLDVLFRYPDGLPFALVAAHGRGRIGLATVSATRDWAEWPLTPFFVIAVQELVKDAVQASVPLLSTEVGGRVALDWAEEATGAEFELVSPAGERRIVGVTRPGVEAPYLLRGFSEPGLYEISRGGKSLRIAVNLPTTESDLAALSRAKLEGDLGGMQVIHARGWDEQRERVDRLRHGRPLWPFLLVLAACLAVCEELFANLRSRVGGLPPILGRLLAAGRGGA